MVIILVRLDRNLKLLCSGAALLHIDVTVISIAEHIIVRNGKETHRMSLMLCHSLYILRIICWE